MSEHDRGAYAPPTADAPLSFDARQPVRGARPFPVTLILSGLVLLGLIAAIFLFYRSGVREAGQPPKTVGSPVGEMKSAAPEDAQPQDPAAGLQIYQSEQGQAGNAPGARPSFVSPPEQPAARPATPAVQAAPP
ncbi:MAG TPA: SPOR domain-containing protein, partial [Phenylobacterium sp.]|nr:SPOR domain-containing protein [Phenylobacterium sp.]